MRLKIVYTTFFFGTLLVSGITVDTNVLASAEQLALPPPTTSRKPTPAPTPKPNNPPPPSPPKPTSVPKPNPPPPTRPAPASKPNPPPAPKPSQNPVPSTVRSKTFRSISASRSTWDTFKASCGKFSRVKRSVYSKPADHQDVQMGYFSQSIGGLWTNGLRTCMGVVVTGMAPAGHRTNILMHMTSADTSMDSEFERFKVAVEKAKLTGVRAYISAPDRAVDWGRMNNLKQLTGEVFELLNSKVGELVHGSPAVVPRDLNLVDAPANTNGPHGEMSVNKDGQVTIEGMRI